MRSSFLVEFQQRDPMDSSIESNDARAFAVPVTDPFAIVRNSAGVITSGVIDQDATDVLERIWCGTRFGHVDPAWAVVVVPLAPGQRVVVVVRVHRQGKR